MTVEGGVEVELKAETWLPRLCGLKPGQAWFNLAGVLPYLIYVDSENQQEFLERDFQTSSQAKKFVNAGNRSGFLSARVECET